MRTHGTPTTLAGLILLCAANAAPVALAGFRRGNFSLPNSLLGPTSAIIEAFKLNTPGNSGFTCSRNGLPCGVDAEGGGGDGAEGKDDDDDDAVGITRVTEGGLSQEEFTDDEGVEHTVISGEVFNTESSSFSDSSFSDPDPDSDSDSDSDSDDNHEDNSHAADRSHTCTRNGVPCGKFRDGSQRQLKVDRTSGCTRNGIPFAASPGALPNDDGAAFKLNRSNDSQKTCIRNGVPCDSYGEGSGPGNEYRVTTGGNAQRDMVRVG